MVLDIFDHTSLRTSFPLRDMKGNSGELAYFQQVKEGDLTRLYNSPTKYLVFQSPATVLGKRFRV